MSDFMLSCERMRTYANRTFELRSSEKLQVASLHRLKLHAPKERVLINKSSKILIFDLPYVFFDE